MKFKISGNIVDIIEEKIFPGTIFIDNGVISEIKPEKTAKYSNLVLPGLIDSHIHIESSLLSPSEFARNAVRFGSVATISDPHEISNVCGLDGIYFMIENGKQTHFKFFFGAPSCVPATPFETSGSKITPKDIDFLFKHLEVNYLSEMMNYPGVISEDPDVLSKIYIAKEFGLPIDGHCPGLLGINLKKYIEFGITTDHECTNIDEAEEKIINGMKILIREGSAAKNFEELIPLLRKYPDKVMFCSDDLHPFDLLNGHINILVKKALERGFDKFQVLRAATLNPILHYKIPVGILRVGDDADFIVIDNFENFNVKETYIKGNLVSKNGESFISKTTTNPINNFKVKPKKIDDFKIHYEGKNKIRVIGVKDHSLITEELLLEAKIEDNMVVADIERDILKIVVINRYEDTKPSVGFIKNIGIKKGAFATTIAHDSHNIISIGADDQLITKVVNILIENKGGIAYADDSDEMILKLPIAGLMTDENIDEVSQKYLNIENKIKSIGSKLTSPLMSTSFMSLLVIPRLKIGDKGLFNVNSFKFVNLFVD